MFRICIIDDDKEKIGTYLRGIQIVGTRNFKFNFNK